MTAFSPRTLSAAEIANIDPMAYELKSRLKVSWLFFLIPIGFLMILHLGGISFIIEAMVRIGSPMDADQRSLFAVLFAVLYCLTKAWLVAAIPHLAFVGTLRVDMTLPFKQVMSNLLKVCSLRAMMMTYEGLFGITFLLILTYGVDGIYLYETIMTGTPPPPIPAMQYIELAAVSFSSIIFMPVILFFLLTRLQIGSWLHLFSDVPKPIAYDVAFRAAIQNKWVRIPAAKVFLLFILYMILVIIPWGPLRIALGVFVMVYLLPKFLHYFIWNFVAVREIFFGGGNSKVKQKETSFASTPVPQAT